LIYLTLLENITLRKIISKVKFYIKYRVTRAVVSYLKEKIFEIIILNIV